MKLKNLLEQRKKDVVAISENASIKEAAELMCRNKIGTLLVFPEGENKPVRYTGVVSDSDIISAICKFDDISKQKVKDIMTSKIIVATSEDKVEYCINVMMRHKISHLPVIHNGEVYAVISIRDMLTALYNEDETKIRYYGDYISGTYHSDVF